jgi:hypothetical protein
LDFPSLSVDIHYTSVSVHQNHMHRRHVFKSPMQFPAAGTGVFRIVVRVSQQTDRIPPIGPESGTIVASKNECSRTSRAGRIFHGQRTGASTLLCRATSGSHERPIDD